jgi:integrase
MDDVIRMHDGKLVLYRRNGIWQARLHLGGNNYLPKSLKTANTEDAKRLGEELWHDTRYELSKGLPVRKRTLNSVLDEYIRFRERDNKMGKAAGSGSSIKYTSDEMLRQVNRVQLFWREYAGKRVIDAIDKKVLSDYVPWRKDYYHNMAEVPKRAKLNPTDKTLQWEMMFGKMVLRYAKDRGYLGDKPLPSFSFKLKTKRIRPDFTIGDFGHLKTALISWHDKANSTPRKASRQLLHDYVLTLALSGIRIGEANNLKVRDVQRIKDDLGRENIQFHVRGKTGARIVVPHIDVKEIIDNLLTRRGNPSPDEWLFAMPDGKKITSVRDQFDKLLEEFKLTHNAAGSKHSLYSLRHFYAVRAIARDIDIYTIARNMGTSVQMIEQYYGRHATTTSRATKLGGNRAEYERSYGPIPQPRKGKLDSSTRLKAAQLTA